MAELIKNTKKETELSKEDMLAQLEKTAWTFIRTVVDITLDSFLILDPKLRVIVANSHFYNFFKVRPKETEGRLVYHLGKGQWDIAKLKKLLEDVLPKKIYFRNFDVAYNFPEIGEKVLRLSARQIYEEVGSLKTVATPMILLVIEDITEREELKRKLALNEKMAALGKLSGLLVHELRNSLSAIRNSTYSLRIADINNKQVGRSLLILEKEGEKMDKIINDILGFAFGFARMQGPNKTKKNIIKIIERALLEVDIPKNIKIKLTFDKIPLILVEEIHMSQLFFNIIKNAVEAMPDGGLLTITAKRQAKEIVVSMQDTGCGIKKNDLKKIFEPLFSTKSQGTGLGLTVCQRILKLYNGTMHVESKIGKGTLFVIKIPLEGGGKKNSIIN